jgi:hypothetical protein
VYSFKRSFEGCTNLNQRLELCTRSPGLIQSLPATSQQVKHSSLKPLLQPTAILPLEANRTRHLHAGTCVGGVPHRVQNFPFSSGRLSPHFCFADLLVGVLLCLLFPISQHLDWVASLVIVDDFGAILTEPNSMTDCLTLGRFHRRIVTRAKRSSASDMTGYTHVDGFFFP